MARASESDVVINDAFFAELGKGPAVTALVNEKANNIATRAKTTAPRDTNDYADSIHIETKKSAYRSVALVVAGDPKSLLVEAKTGNLVRAMKAEARNA